MHSTARRVVATAAPLALEESIRWRVIRLLELGGRQVIAAGEQTYDPYRDVAVKPVKGSTVDARTVSLPLGYGFAVRAPRARATKGVGAVPGSHR